jgi:hypothetical protein
MIRGMKTLNILGLLTALACSNVSQAQQTWNGLRFGMTVAEVRAKVRLVKAKDADAPDAAVGSSYSGPTLKIDSYTFKPLFVFNPRLKMIVLAYDAFGVAEDARPFYGNMIATMTGELSAKYGRPVAVDGACEPESTEGTFGHCNYVWSSGGQKISMSAYGDNGRILTLVIGYDPLPSGL